MEEKPRVLFLCTHNAARSQIAEALLRHIAGDRFEAASAGLDPTTVHPLTYQVLKEAGVDTSGLSSKSVDTFLGRQAVRYAIIVCEQVETRCPKIFPFTTQTFFWRFDDPAQPEGAPDIQLAKFRRVRDELDTRIRAWLREE